MEIAASGGGWPSAQLKLAAVYRTVHWVVEHPEALDEQRYLGSNCGRLMDQAIGLLPEAAASEKEPLLRARALLAGFEGRPAAARLDALQHLLDELTPIVERGVLEPPPVVAVATPEPPPVADPPPAAPATPAPAPEATAAPAKSRRRVWDGSGGDTWSDVGMESAKSDADRYSAAAWLGDEAKPAVEERKGRRRRRDRDDRPAQKDSSDKVETKSEAPDGEPRRASLEELIADAKRSGKKKKTPKPRVEEPPPAVPLPLGHADGTGRSVRTLAGLSTAEADALEKAGIATIADVLMTPPASHERYPLVHPGTPAPEGNVTVRGRLRYRFQRIAPRERRWEAILEGREATIRAVWSQREPHGWAHWSRGQELALVGVVSTTGDGSPEAGSAMHEPEPVGIDGRGSGFIPLYGVPGVDDAVVRHAAAAALLEYADLLKDPLPAEVREAQRLLAIGEALRESHFPSNSAGRGRIRLAFDELYLLQLGIGWGTRTPRGGRGYQHAVLHRALGELQLQHGITLEDGQELAFHEIRRDMVRQRPMMRLLQGDVGAGKGLVALMAAAIAVENKSQVAMVFPDAATAERRFLFAEQLLRSVGVVPMLVGQEPTHAQIDAIKRGEVHVAFGTESLLQDHGWKRLGLVVAESRVGHGPLRLQDLPGKSQRPDLLCMTQAPIPTTLVFTLFRDFDVTLVSTADRVHCVSRRFEAAERADAYAAAREQLDEGRQVYVVFPIEDGTGEHGKAGHDLLGLDDARRFADALRADAFPHARIGIFSSAMSRDERFRVHDDFAHRRVDVLVCTSPIEDAPSVPNATTMVVEYADRYDLTRLHRLRGHVGQGTHPGKAIFVLTEGADEEGVRRLELVLAEHDGFRIAELDLQMRGLDDILGTRASDAPKFRYVDPVRDRELLLKARLDAQQSARERLSNAALVQAVERRWGEWLGEAGLSIPEPTADNGEGGPRKRRRRRRKK
jgi:ATP-dependent DNA helicase RecG